MARGLWDNFGNPQGFFGRVILNAMNLGHGAPSKWYMSHMDWIRAATVLDVGCGGGVNIRKMLELCPQGKLYGIDISEESVKKSKKINADSIGKRCEIVRGNVENLPYTNDKFDVVTAFETIYFWQDIGGGLQEIYRVLKSGGRVLIGCEMTDRHSIWSKKIDGMNIYSPNQLGDLLEKTGYQSISLDKHEKGWTCLTGQKR